MENFDFVFFQFFADLSDFENDLTQVMACIQKFSSLTS